MDVNNKTGFSLHMYVNKIKIVFLVILFPVAVFFCFLHFNLIFYPFMPYFMTKKISIKLCIT